MNILGLEFKVPCNQELFVWMLENTLSIIVLTILLHYSMINQENFVSFATGFFAGTSLITIIFTIRKNGFLTLLCLTVLALMATFMKV